MKILTASLFAFVITAAAGCSDPTSPEADMPEQFNLTAIDDKRVPFVKEERSTPDGTCFTIYQGGDLRFVRGGRFEMLLSVEQEFCNGVRVRGAWSWQSGRYRTSGETVEFFPDKSVSPFTGTYRPARTNEDGSFSFASILVYPDGPSYRFVADRELYTGSTR